MIDDALGGFDIVNCDDDEICTNKNSCTNSNLLTTTTTSTESTTQQTSIENNELFDYNNDKNSQNQKYAFDVIDINNNNNNIDDEENNRVDNGMNNDDDNDDGVARTYENNSYVNSLDYINKKVDDSHKKIVRVSLQKNEHDQQLHHTNDKLKELCFAGDMQNYKFYGFNKSIKYEKMYQQINVNIRFKTFDENGLLLLVYQKLGDVEDIFLSLSIENG